MPSSGSTTINSKIRHLHTYNLYLKAMCTDRRAVDTPKSILFGGIVRSLVHLV